MITIKDALENHIKKLGRPKQYRVVKLVFCTADRKRDVGGRVITLNSARLCGTPIVEKNRKESHSSAYRKGSSWLDFYDEDTCQYYKVHIDLILFVNDETIS